MVLLLNYLFHFLINYKKSNKIKSDYPANSETILIFLVIAYKYGNAKLKYFKNIY